MRGNLHNLYNPKVYETVGCTLQAYGTNFEPDVFLSESNFSQDEIQFKGELLYPSALEIFDTPFLLISMSEASELPLQIKEATLFLKHHLDDLKKLQSYPNVENVLIQFMIEQDESVCNSQNFPAEFSDLCLEIGIQGVLFRTLNSHKI
jgi:hypothetical protein